LGPTGQETVLLQTPLLLNALLNVSIARNWLFPSLFVMRLQAYLTQALPPAAAVDKNQFLRSLEGKDDPTISDIKKTVIERWGRVEIVDAVFKGMQFFAWHSFYIVSLTQH
jgi:translocation protein SEC63